MFPSIPPSVVPSLPPPFSLLPFLLVFHPILIQFSSLRSNSACLWKRIPCVLQPTTQTKWPFLHAPTALWGCPSFLSVCLLVYALVFCMQLTSLWTETALSLCPQNLAEDIVGSQNTLQEENNSPSEFTVLASVFAFLL